MSIILKALRKAEADRGESLPREGFQGLVYVSSFRARRTRIGAVLTAALVLGAGVGIGSVRWKKAVRPEKEGAPAVGRPGVLQKAALREAVPKPSLPPARLVPASPGGNAPVPPPARGFGGSPPPAEMKREAALPPPKPPVPSPSPEGPAKTIPAKPQGPPHSSLEPRASAPPGVQPPSGGALGQARILEDQGDAEAARKAYEALLSLGVQEVEAQMGLGRLAERAGREDEAIRHYLAVLRDRPGLVAAHSALGRLYAQREDPIPAINELMLAVRFSGEAAEPLYDLSALHARLGNSVAAADFLGRAVAKDHRFAERALADPAFVGLRESAVFKRLLQPPAKDVRQ